MDLVGKNVTQEDASILSDKLRGELLKTGRFQVMERAQMDAILTEQGFQRTGVCADDACLVEMGQLIGVQKMIAGSIGKLGSMYLVSIRMIDMAKGKIDKNVDREIEGGIEDVLKSGIPHVARAISVRDAEPSTASAAAPPAPSTRSTVKGGMGPMFISCLIGPRVALEHNEGSDVRSIEWISLILNVFGGGTGRIVSALQGSKNGLSGAAVGCCVGPRAGEQFHERKLRGKEKLCFIPVVGGISHILMSLEALDGKTMSETEAAENLRR